MTTGSSNATPVWSAAGGGPARTGLWPGRVQLEPKPVRRLLARGALQAGVVFDAAGRALVADLAGWVQAFAPEGRLLWRRQLEGAVSATPAADLPGGRVFVGTHRGWVYALQTGDGTILWRRWLPTQSDARIVSDLLFAPATPAVVASGWGGQFHALDPFTGETKRTWDAGLWPQAGASADASGNLYGVRAVRGEGVAGVRWAVDGTERVLLRQAEGKRSTARMVAAAAPVVDDAGGVVYFCVGGDRETSVYAWSEREDRVLWRREVPRITVATPALQAQSGLVVAGMDGALRAFAPDGAPRFCIATEADYLLAGAVCDAEGTAFLGDPLGRLHAVDRAGIGRVLFEAPRSIQARPAFDRLGSLHLPCTDGTVYVFRNQAVA